MLFIISLNFLSSKHLNSKKELGIKLSVFIKSNQNSDSVSPRVEKYRRKRRTKRRFLSVFVGFIGFACKKRRFLSVFVGFVEIVGIAVRNVGLSSPCLQY